MALGADRSTLVDYGLRSCELRNGYVSGSRPDPTEVLATILAVDFSNRDARFDRAASVISRSADGSLCERVEREASAPSQSSSMPTSPTGFNVSLTTLTEVQAHLTTYARVGTAEGQCGFVRVNSDSSTLDSWFEPATQGWRCASEMYQALVAQDLYKGTEAAFQTSLNAVWNSEVTTLQCLDIEGSYSLTVQPGVSSDGSGGRALTMKLEPTAECQAAAELVRDFFGNADSS